ncbi:MAG TPA: aldehyde dehydrogenase family protein [Blastocatellia bacterium]|nr:aldehyde dehydrogenase family protein [Blastocatellia bacterium]
MFIHGRRIDAGRHRTYEVINPANGERVGSAILGDAADAGMAVESAKEAQRQWAETSVSDRAELLEKGLAAVSEQARALSILLTREQGKPLPEAVAEIENFVYHMRAFISLGKKSRDGRIPLPPSMRAASKGKIKRQEEGISVGLVAWNFPVSLMAKKAGPALISGNPIIIKPAFTTPLTAARVIELLNEAGLPPGVLNCVTGSGKEVGEALINHSHTGRVHLTGSNETGKKIAEITRDLSPDLLLELAGSNPMIVCADADLPKAVNGALIGRFRNAGQVCTAVKRLYLASKIYDEFLDRLVGHVRLYEPGDGLVEATSPRVRIGPLHTAGQREEIEGQLLDAVSKGARVVIGGKRPAGEGLGRGYFFEPTVVTDVSKDSKLVTEEVFGPVLPVFKVSSLDEAIAEANDSRWDLGASIWTQNRDSARRAAKQIHCQRVWVNQLQFGSDRAGLATN